jgi:hypothetical protein
VVQLVVLLLPAQQQLQLLVAVVGRLQGCRL